MRTKGKLNIGFEGDEGVVIQRYEPKDPTLPPQPPPLTDPATAKEQKDLKDKKDDKPTRERWKNKAEFLFSCISLAIGFGNVWRFPFVVLENGGGAFFIVYPFVLLFVARPMYYFECCLGQFASSGPIDVWELLPAFRGVGYGQILTNWFVTTYYVFLMAMCLFFFFASFSPELPWASCGLWASDACVDATTNVTLLQRGTSAAEEYLVNEVLKVDPEGFRSGIGLPDIRLCMCLVVSWAVLFLAQANGIKTSGKTAYFTAIVPYLLLLTLLIRGVTMPGSVNGIVYLFTPRWEALLDVQVWFAATSQATYSLAIGYGTVITLASYNDFRNKIHVYSTVVCLTDTVTSILSGITTFAILGHLADLLGVDVSEVVHSGGASLSFISYPDALARFPWAPQLFSVLFFLMMFTLGLGSAVVANNVLITSFKDKFPHLQTWKVTMGVCLLGLFSGLIYTTPQGQHVLTLVNHYSANLSILLLLTLEVVGVAWLYGLSRFTSDIHFMLSRSTALFWKACWLVVDPIFLAGMLIYSQTQATVLTYGDYEFGSIETGLGITMSVLPVVLVPVMFLVEVGSRYKASGQLLQALKNTFAPSDKWGPRDEKMKQDYDNYMVDK